MIKSGHVILSIMMLVIFTSGIIVGTNLEKQPEISPQVQCSISPPTIDHEVNKTRGYSFRIIAPDSDYCILTGVVLSQDNYTAMQNNVGIFTVLDKTPVTAKPTHNYCQLAQWLYDAHTDTYPQVQERFEKYMLPAWCEPELHPLNITNYKIVLNDTISFTDNNTAVVPEFGGIVFMIIILSLLAATIISSTKWKYNNGIQRK